MKKKSFIKEQSSEKLVAFVEEYLRSLRGIDGKDALWQKLPGDASDRILYRVMWQRGSLILVTNENPRKNEGGVNENDSFEYICCHLKGKGIAVPEIYGFKKEEGWFLLEDLGEVHLYDEVLKRKGCSREIMTLYKKVLKVLPRIQVEGSLGFDQKRVLAPPYDLPFILERESGYFCTAFLKGYLHLPFDEEGLQDELHALALRASQVNRSFFLYYDFQSKNIMVQNGRLRFIDFQGGKKGPLHYDLASLLLDPYVNIAEEMRQELIHYYLDQIEKFLPVNREEFLLEYPYIALHRIMQMLGAFGFLSTVKKKPSFASYIPVAIENLKRVFQLDVFSPYRKLRRIIGAL